LIEGKEVNERVGKMAEFIRGGAGVPPVSKEKLHGSPSTGSEDGQDGLVADEFDPFLADNEEAESSNTTLLIAPHENQ